MQNIIKMMEFDSIFVKKYAKKILGFSYNKTHNTVQAEDLSQEILISLANSLKRQTEIVDMDGFVYTICCYTWSTFLRKNKKHWNNIDINEMYDLRDSSDVEEEVWKNMLIDRMKTEIAYLTKLHRQITLMFYYENKTSDEIADILHISHSTIRWHLGEIRKKLKEGMEMTTNNLNYTPQKIMAGCDGYTLPRYDQCGLGEDRLVDNICIACYGKTLTVEEIARVLSVASGYIENHIERLLYMDYLRVVNKNKYTTNFFISEIRHQAFIGKYHFYNIAPYAEKIYEAIAKRCNDIISIGFLGNDLDKDFLLWALIPILSSRLYWKSSDAVLRKNSIVLETPKRKDGSQHWVIATIYDDRYWEHQMEFTKDEIEFYMKSTGNGIKTRDDGLGNAAFQLDSRATINIGIHWRHFGEQNVSEINRIAEIIRNGEIPNELDKLVIARETEQGYVKMENETLKLLIPVFTKDENEQLENIFYEIYDEIGEEIFVDYIEKFAETFDKEIPDFIPKQQRIYLKYKVYPQYAILYWLSDNGFLRYPTDEEAKRLCTVVWNTVK